ncbi:MAG: ArnT family glycosyltransferase [Myxococcota bacterium]
MIALVLAGLALRLPLVGWYACPYTDGFAILATGLLEPAKRLPFYPTVVEVIRLATGADGIFVGRTVSALSGALTGVPVFLLADRLAGRRAGWIAALLFLVSPLPLRWSIRVMTDVTFVLWSWLGLWWLVRAVERGDWRRAGGAIFCFGLAMLTRPEGILFAPIVLLLLLGLAWRSWASSLKATFGLLPWVLWGLWVRRLPEDTAYGSVARQNLERLGLDHLDHVASFLGGYELAMLHALTPPVVVLAALGIHVLIRSDPEENRRARRVALAAFAYLALGCWAIACIHTHFSTRHLLYFVPMVPILAAAGFERVRRRRPRMAATAVATATVWSVALSIVALQASQDAFGDLARAARASRADGFDGRILSTHYRSRQTRYIAGGDVGQYNPQAVRPGDRVVMNSLAVSKRGIQRQLVRLRSKFEIEVIARTHAATKPLLGDESCDFWRRNGTIEHAMGHWFREHRYESVVVAVGARRGSDAEHDVR